MNRSYNNSSGTSCHLMLSEIYRNICSYYSEKGNNNEEKLLTTNTLNEQTKRAVATDPCPSADNSLYAVYKRQRTMSQYTIWNDIFKF